VKLRTFFKRFFQNPKKRDFLRFFEWLTTFSRTLDDTRKPVLTVPEDTVYSHVGDKITGQQSTGRPNN